MLIHVDWNDDLQTELCHDDDGFVYRRKRRRRSDDELISGSASAQPDLEQERMLWRRHKLCRLLDKYRNEIRYWELLADSLRNMEERLVSVCEDMELVESVKTGCDSDDVRVVDEMLLKVEEHEATINHISNLWNAAESLCIELEEQRNKLFTDLSLWVTSPRKLIALLCD